MRKALAAIGIIGLLAYAVLGVMCSADAEAGSGLSPVSCINVRVVKPNVRWAVSQDDENIERDVLFSGNAYHGRAIDIAAVQAFRAGTLKICGAQCKADMNTCVYSGCGDKDGGCGGSMSAKPICTACGALGFCCPAPPPPNNACTFPITGGFDCPTCVLAGGTCISGNTQCLFCRSVFGDCASCTGSGGTCGVSGSCPP